MRYLHFCPDFFITKKNSLIRKLLLVSEFMTSQAGQQIITIHIFPNISRSKDSQTKKFGQLIEHNMRNIFLEKLYTKYGAEASFRPFYKNQISAYLWINSLECYKVCFHCSLK